MADDILKPLIHKVSTGQTLTREEIQTVLGAMTEGHATPAQMGAF